MTITINGTTGIAGVDGSASTPAIQGADTNTGIAFPAADTVAIATGGSERIRVDSSGNVGIGTNSPLQRLHVETVGGATAINALPLVTNNSNTSTTNRRSGILMRTVTSASAEIVTAVYAEKNTSDTAVMGFATNGTERMRITSDGEVLVGGTTAIVADKGAITIEGTNTSGYLTLFRNDTSIDSGNALGQIRFNGNDTTSNTPTQLAYINAVASGTHAAGDNPTDIVFGTTPDGSATVTEVVRFNQAGNVGIGTSSPGNKLHVVSTGNTAAQITGKSTAAAFGSSTFWDGTGGGLQITNSETTTNAPTSIRFTQTGATDTAAGIAAVFSSSSASNLVFCTNNGGVTVPERMRITSGGEVYIAGTTDQGAYNLQCNGTGVWGAGAYVNGSDARIKEDVAPIDSGLDVVEKLNPVTYRYKEDWSKDQSVQTGFIAQELLVALDGKNYVDGIVQQGGAEGYYSVAYQNIIPILTKAIQELNAKVEAQAAEIAALKGSNNV